MNKYQEYQEAINELYKQRSERYKVYQKHKDWSKEIVEFDKVGDSLRTLQELVDSTKQPTLYECIKEWEKDGWKVEEDGYFNQIYLSKGNDGIIFDISEKNYCLFNGENTTPTLNVNLKLSERLTKTLKAMEVEGKNEQNKKF